MNRVAVLLLFAARPLLAGYAARDLVLPVVGRAASSERTFLTTVWITNVSSKPATATLSVLAVHATPTPPANRITIEPGATRVFDPFDVPLGALRIQSDADLVASARVQSNELSTSFAAIPARFAVGAGQSSLMQGYVSGGGQYKLYLAEIAGQALAYTVTIRDGSGKIRGEKRLFIDRLEQARLDLSQLFPGVDGVTVRIEGTNGNGKLIAMGLQRMPGTQDASAFEMSFPAPPRFALTWIEGATYAFLAVAVIAAALTRRR